MLVLGRDEWHRQTLESKDVFSTGFRVFTGPSQPLQLKCLSPMPTALRLA